MSMTPISGQGQGASIGKPAFIVKPRQPMGELMELQLSNLAMGRIPDSPMGTSNVRAMPTTQQPQAVQMSLPQPSPKPDSASLGDKLLNVLGKIGNGVKGLGCATGAVLAFPVAVPSFIGGIGLDIAKLIAGRDSKAYERMQGINDVVLLPAQLFKKAATTSFESFKKI